MSGTEILERGNGKVLNGTVKELLKWGLGGISFAFVAYMCYLMLAFIMGGQSLKVEKIEVNTTKMLELQSWNNKLTSDRLEMDRLEAAAAAKRHEDMMRALEEIRRSNYRGGR